MLHLLKIKKEKIRLKFVQMILMDAMHGNQELLKNQKEYFLNENITYK